MKKYGYKDLQKKEKLSKEEVLKFWRKPLKTSDVDNNHPTHYLKGEQRSSYLVELINQYVRQDSKILEIGCNVGRNLNFLFESGFVNLSGIELNEEAVGLMKTAYPDMFKESLIIPLPVEKVIKDIPDNSYELVYTMAVLEHLHYDNDFVLGEIARISKKFIITVEDEKTEWSERHFPRNYRDVFENSIWKQVYEVNCKILRVLDDRFWVRVFMKRDDSCQKG